MGLSEIRALKDKAGQPKPPKNYTIPKVSKKKAEQIAQNKELNKGGGGELNRWFNERRLEMTGKCQNCSGKTCKDDDNYFKFSIAHLLPEAYFKSVATHPDNFLELCHFGNSCHTNLDNHAIDLIELSCFDTVIQKFTKIYPSIAKEERRRIPKILLEYIEVEK